ncbi:MAG: DHH family phosphoesterase [Prochlorothrix sp.]|nr:DHH family phosphoesterase [Prochlorothrix sp.]
MSLPPPVRRSSQSPPAPQVAQPLRARVAPFPQQRWQMQRLAWGASAGGIDPDAGPIAALETPQKEILPGGQPAPLVLGATQEAKAAAGTDRADRITAIATALDLLPPVVQILQNRGLTDLEDIGRFLDPDRLELPDPATEFEDLNASVELLAQAVQQGQRIAICGDYDADGMTSTALLIRALRGLGGVVDYAIPSRMQEGYGINERIVEEFHQEGVSLVLTVDNGIAAYGPIARARELGLTVIVTDHHDLPPLLPPADGILNPKLLPETSVYRGLAGVGVAYVLAVALTDRLGQSQALTQPLLELFTLGTIADLAPLVGVNRCWVKRGLNLLARSRILGIQTLIQEAGIQVAEADQLALGTPASFGPGPDPSPNPSANAPSPKSPKTPQSGTTTKTLKPEDIGFRLGPRINAIGRIGDPQVVIELLITEDPEIAQQRAAQCEAANNQRKKLCEDIEQEAIDRAETQRDQLIDRRVLLVLGEHWHHGVIGIVASRLVERYGVPVFIATWEDEAGQQIRGSARGIPEFHVAEALEYCTDLLAKHGGHRAAGGFSLAREQWEAFHQRLIEFANQHLQPEHLKPLVEVDTELTLGAIDGELFHQIDRLHPWGIGNPEPVFWSRGVRVLEQRQIGQAKNHLKLTLGAEIETTAQVAIGNKNEPAAQTEATLTTIKAVAWRWGEYYPLPTTIDLAYRLRENEWRGQVTIELELVGIRLPGGATTTVSREPDAITATPNTPNAVTSHPAQQTQTVSFTYQDRPYSCAVYDRAGTQELRIRNGQGQVLAVQEGQTTGLLGADRDSARSIDVQDPFFYHLIQAAVAALQPYVSA